MTQSLRAALAEKTGLKNDASITRLLDAVAEFSPDLVEVASEHAQRRAISDADRAAMLGQLVIQFGNTTDDGARIAMLDAIADLLAQLVESDSLEEQRGPFEAAKTLLRKVIAGGFARPVSSAAARAMAISRDETFLQRVRASLGSQNPAEVRLAACMLGFARDRVSAPALIELVVPDNMAVFDALIWSLGEIGSPDALPILHFLLETLMFTPELVEALGKIGDEASLLPLLETLVSGDEETRASAAQAIVRVIRKNEGKISEEIASPTRAILERVIDHDEARLSRYFSLIAFALLGGSLHANRVLGALGAKLPAKELSPMSAFFVQRSSSPKP